MENNPRNDHDHELRNQRARCLKTIADLGERLRQQRNQYPNSCENYLAVLENLEKKVSKKKSKIVLDRCEEELSRYWNIISENFSSPNSEREAARYSRSPDSTATLDNVVDITQESGRYVYDHRKRDNSNDYRPDSTTLNEGPYGSSNRPNESQDTESEVSSSSNKINSTMHVPDNTFPSLYSRRRDTSIDRERSGNELDDPVQLIMNTVKNRLGHDKMLNQSSLSNYEGMSSTEEIERYEGTLKSQFFENDLPPKPAGSETHDENKLSSMLEKLMVRRESSSNSNFEIPSTSNINAASSIPDLNSLNLSPNKNADSHQKKEKPISLRAKMAQDIGMLHKAGESDKIRPSLKQLKSDKNQSTSAVPLKLDVPITQPDDKISTSSPKDKDDYRSKRSSDSRRHSDHYSRSPRSPSSYSRISSRESPHGYRSPDDYHSSNRRRRSRSRSHERYRDHRSESSNSDKISPKNNAKDGTPSNSLESFVNSIGHGRYPPDQRKPDESQKKDDRNKNDANDSKPNLKVKKKNFHKFKVNTNLPASTIEQNVKNDSAEVEPASTANRSDVSPPQLPLSPAYNPSPRYSTSPGCSESSASPRITPSTEPRFHKVNNYNDKREGFPNGNKVDPRLKQPFPKHIDPRLERHPYQKTGFPKDPRGTRGSVPPSLISLPTEDVGFSNIPRTPDAGFSNIPRTPDAGFPKDPRVPAASFPTPSRENTNKYCPRVVEQSLPNLNFAKDPRLVSSSAPNVPKENNTSYSRPIPSLAAHVPKENNTSYSRPVPSSAPNVPKDNSASFSQDKSKSSTFVPPVTKENKPNRPSFSQNKPPPNRNWDKNKFANNNTKPFPKKNPKANISYEPKNNLPKARSTTDIKEQVKNSNEFLSPLQDVYQTSAVTQTGRGYGEQRLKKPGPKPFKIPKLRKPSSDTDKFTENSTFSNKESGRKTSVSNDNDDWNELLDNAPTPEKPIGNSTSSAKGNKKKIFHDDDDEDWDSAISNNNDVSSVTTTQPEPSVPPSSSTVNENRRNSIDSATANENRRNSTNSATIDITTNIDEEECWDPIDSPPVEPAYESDMNDDVVEVPIKNTIIEIDDDDNQGHDDVEDLTAEKSSDDVIEIDDNDDVDKSTSRRDRSAENDCTSERNRPGTSSSARIEVYSVENDDSSRPESTRSRAEVEGKVRPEANDAQTVQKRLTVQDDSNSTTASNLPTRKDSVVGDDCSVVENRPSSDSNVKQNVPDPQVDSNEKPRDEILKTKLMNYLNSLSNPPEISEKDKQLSPLEFIFKLFHKLDSEAFDQLKTIISRHENSSDNETEGTPPPAEEAPEPPAPVQTATIIKVTKRRRGRKRGRKYAAAEPTTSIEPTTPAEPTTPTEPTTGRKRGKKNASVESATPVEMTTIAQPIVPVERAALPEPKAPPRTRLTELDRLHADIEKMKNTKNNVLGIGETRKCRLQSANYSENKPIRRSNEDWMSSESDFDGAVRGGMRRARSKPDLSSDNDSIASKKRFKSKRLISSDSSNDEDSESDDGSFPTIRRTSKELNIDTYDAIRKYKACPRRKKIERFGSTSYEQFEEDEGRKDLSYMKKKHCPKEPIPVLPRYPSTCDNLDSCVCHSQSRSDSSKSESIDSKQLKVVNSFLAKTESRSDPIQPKSDCKSPRKRKLKPGKASKLRMKMSKTGHYPNWQVVNQVKNQKGIARKEEVQEEVHCSSNIALLSSTSASDCPSTPVSDSSSIPASDLFASKREPGLDNDSSTTSQGKQSFENTVTEDDANDELKDLPKYNAFKNAEMTSINIATIGVRMCDSALVYICKTNGCAYESVDIAMFALHLTFLHKNWKIEAECTTCGNSQKYLNLKSAFRHISNQHLDLIPSLIQTPVLPIVQIKEEPLDEVPKNEDVKGEERIQEDQPVVENAPNFSPAPANQVPSVVEPTPAPTPPVTPPATPPPKEPTPKVIVSPQLASILRNAPKIRVRKLSGDKLSGPDTSSDSQRSTPEIRNIPESIPSSSSEAGSVIVEPAPSTTFVDVGESTASNIVSTHMNSFITENELNLMQFYKCSEERCGFCTNHKKEFLNHLHTVHKNSKRSKKFDPACLGCKYCSKTFETPEMLVIHMEKYDNCKFQCAYCKFRASRPVYLLWHTNANHRCLDTRILVSSLDDNKETLITRSDHGKDLRGVVAPIRCVHCNNFKTFSFEEYKDHWRRNHSQTDSYQCSVCKASSFSLDSSLKHLIFHGYGEYQCVYCMHGAASEDAIKSHLLRDHFILYPKAVKRITPKDSDTQNTPKFEDYVEILDLDESLDNLRKHFVVVDRNKASAVTLHADTPEGSVKATGIYVLNKDKQYVLKLDVEEQAEEQRKEMRRACSTKRRKSSAATRDENNDGVLFPVNVVSETSRNNAGDSNNDDVIAVCSSDDDTSDRLVINEDTSAVLTKTTSRSTISNGLTGTDLYKCGFDGCTAAFETYIPFKDHLPTCDNARYRTSPKCPHCKRTFQKNAAFLTHIALHGIPRYICSLCDTRFTTSKKAEDHVKQTHKVNSLKVIPANPLKNNTHEDLYIVLPNSEKGGGKSHKQYKKFTDSKYLSSASTATTAKQKEAADLATKQITTVYSLQDVERLLPMQLFSEPVTCGICSTYKSKVRQNIIVHLECHSTGLVPVNDITNPVPCTDKSELMFNKMTNHAAFGAKADDKKIKCLIEKMEAYSGDKNEIIPGFVPKTLRFSCGAPDCFYRSTDASRLKSHWETLHSELDFNCPHCGVVIPVEKIHTHLRYHDGRLYKCYYCTKLHFQRQIIENHQLENHPGSSTQIQTIRDLTADEIEELCREARYQSDSSYIRNPVTYSRASMWKCNLCKSYPMMTEDLIKTHCMSCHRVNEQYKCCLCSFADNDMNVVNKHMNEKHESISQVVVTVYKELNENDENSQCSSNTSSPCKAKSSSQYSKSSDGQQSNVANSSDKNAATSKSDRSSRSEIDDSTIAELNHLLILPLSNNRYKCPFCEEFNTTNRRIMQEHLYQEKNYERYVCYDCGTHSVTEAEIKKHAEIAHGEIINIGKFSEDEVVEKQIEQILDYQQNKFDQVSISNDISIEISSGDEDEESGLRISMGYSDDRCRAIEYRCPHCSKVCLNSSGLKNHINYVHVKKNKRNRSQPPTPVSITPAPKPTARISPVSGTIVPIVGGVYPCSYCHKEFHSAVTIAKHLCVCPKYSNPNDKSPIKVNEIKVLASDRILACSYCGKRCNSLELDDHISMCKTEQMNRFQQIERCELCGIETDQSAMDMHRKCKHQPMECLICDKILIGSDALDNHVHESLINISGSNRACIPREKEVVIMCPYCPTGLIGQSYDKYTYIYDHIRTKHNPLERPRKKITVKIRNIVRELMESEITLMQSKYQQEQARKMPLKNETKKKRNVAVKSTMRITTPNIVNIIDGRTSTSPKIQRIGNDSIDVQGYPTPKFNIVYKNSNTSK